MNLYGQNSDIIALQGNADSLVVVNIGTIREANIKLTERVALKEIVAQQDTIIVNQHVIIDKYKEENLYLATSNVDLKKQYNNEIELNNKLSKNLQCIKLGLYITSGISVAAISYIVIGLICNGK